MLSWERKVARIRVETARRCRWMEATICNYFPQMLRLSCRALSTLRVRQGSQSWTLAVSPPSNNDMSSCGWPSMPVASQPPQPDSVSKTPVQLVRRALAFLLPSGYPSSVGASYMPYCVYTALASVFASCNGGWWFVSAWVFVGVLSALT